MRKWLALGVMAMAGVLASVPATAGPPALQASTEVYTAYLRDGNVLMRGGIRMKFADVLEGAGDHGGISLPFDQISAIIPLRAGRQCVVISKDHVASNVFLQKPILMIDQRGDEHTLDLSKIKIIRILYEGEPGGENPEAGFQKTDQKIIK